MLIIRLLLLFTESVLRGGESGFPYTKLEFEVSKSYVKIYKETSHCLKILTVYSYDKMNSSHVWLILHLHK
jgi:hypothetical protein